jgi:hypothetical protein
MNVLCSILSTMIALLCLPQDAESKEVKKSEKHPNQTYRYTYQTYPYGYYHRYNANGSGSTLDFDILPRFQIIINTNGEYPSRSANTRHARHHDRY